MTTVEWNKYFLDTYYYKDRKTTWQHLFREFIKNYSIEEIMKIEKYWSDDHMKIINEYKQKELIKLWKK